MSLFYNKALLKEVAVFGKVSSNKSTHKPAYCEHDGKPDSILQTCKIGIEKKP